MTPSHETTISHDSPTPETLPSAVIPPDGPPELGDAETQRLLSALSRNWGVILSFGIVLAGLGIAIMAWPQATATVVAILTGIGLLVSGVFSIVAGFTAPEQTIGQKVLMVISGVLSILLGLFAFTSTVAALGILAIVLGVGWLIRGIFSLQTLPAKGTPGRGLSMAAGILGILAGISIMVWPSITLTAVIWISGFWFVVFGLIQIVAAFQLKGLARTA